MSDYLYVISAGEDRHKVGRADDVRSRLSGLQVGCPDELVCSVVIKHPNAFSIEGRCHVILAERRIRGEWFRGSLHEILEGVTAAIRQTETRFASIEDDGCQL